MSFVCELKFKKIKTRKGFENEEEKKDFVMSWLMLTYFDLLYD